MERQRKRRSGRNSRGNPHTPRPTVAALFEDRGQAEVAVSDLERNDIPMNRIGIILRASGRERETKRGEDRALIPAAPATGFPGWTMGMAPWVISGVGPMVVLGSLSLTQRKDRPANLKGLGSALGLSEEATAHMQDAFQRQGVLVTVEAPEKEPIATHILERNGGHPLPRSDKSLQQKEH